MSPDLNRKYELAIGEGRYDMASEVRDIGDKRVESPKSISGRSGVGAVFLTQSVANPEITTVVAIETPAIQKIATITTVLEVT